MRCSAVGVGAEVGQGAGLELDHRGLVELVDDVPRRPGQPVCPGVETRGQDHGLPHAGVGGVRGRSRRSNGCGPPSARSSRGGSAAGRPRRRVSPSMSLMNCSMPTARTSGSAHGSSSRASGPFEAAARDGGDRGGGGADAGGQIPGVVVGAGHAVSYFSMASDFVIAMTAREPPIGASSSESRRCGRSARRPRGRVRALTCQPWPVR